MPRPTKAIRRHKINAAAAWKRGEKKEAYKLWEQAAKEYRERLEGKRNKKKKAAEEAAAKEAEAAAQPSE